jgi:hypothetical protein
MTDREELLDELARCFARAAVDALQLKQQRAPKEISALRRRLDHLIAIAGSGGLTGAERDELRVLLKRWRANVKAPA